MIWKLGAADGERLGTGDMVAEIVDCNAPFLLAASVTGHSELTQGNITPSCPSMSLRQSS
jgi:hypothetical protein